MEAKVWISFDLESLGKKLKERKKIKSYEGNPYT